MTPHRARPVHRSIAFVRLLGGGVIAVARCARCGGTVERYPLTPWAHGQPEAQVRYLLDNPDVYLVRGRWVRIPKSWLPTP